MEVFQSAVEFRDTSRGHILDDFYPAPSGHVDLLGIDEEYGDIGACIADEAGGRVDHEAGADDGYDVGSGHEFGGTVEVGDAFSKKDNPRA